MEINKLTNLNVNTELYTNGIGYDDETVESETIKNADYKVSNDSVDEDSVLDIEDDKVVAESSEKKDTSNVGTEQTFSENGVVIKYTLNSADAEFSCKVFNHNITIEAKNCTINLNEVPSGAKLNLKGEKVTLNSNVQLKSIGSSADDSTINGSKYDDNIINRGNNCTINAGAGNDTIKSTGRDATINGEDGNDTITNKGLGSSVVNGGAGNDTITSSCWNSVVDGGAGNDNITVEGQQVEVNGGEGNDNITGEGLTKSKINGGAGNDNIANVKQTLGQYSTDTAIKKKNTFNEKTATVIDGGDGEDNIDNAAYNVKINNAENSDNISIAQLPDLPGCGNSPQYAQKMDTKINYQDGTSIDLYKDDYSQKSNITVDTIGSKLAMFMQLGMSYDEYTAEYNATDCHGGAWNKYMLNKVGASYTVDYNKKKDTYTFTVNLNGVSYCFEEA